LLGKAEIFLVHENESPKKGRGIGLHALPNGCGVFWGGSEAERNALVFAGKRVFDRKNRKKLDNCLTCTMKIAFLV
jgi:hypothetical protein